MIKIDLLKNHLDTIPELAKMWHEGLGRIWLPEVPLVHAEQRFREHANSDKMPLTSVALHEGKAVGMCSLRENDGIRPDLMPWLGSLAVRTDYRNKGIGRQLIESVKQEAKKFGFSELYLFAFDRTIPVYYQSLGWKIIDTDNFKGYPVTVMKICCS
jgi:N-acetylglutamate synthase-like GNAT family acetyltransferase